MKINEIVVSKKFLFSKNDFKYFFGCKEIRASCIFLSEMIIYNRYSDQTKCIYFMIKDENIFGNF